MIDRHQNSRPFASFDSIYERAAPRLLRYALRRTIDLADAEDAVADTFVIAWRRLDDVPPEPATLPWLFAVARRVIANQRRGRERRNRLIDRLRGLRRPLPPTDAPVTGGIALAALGRMSSQDQELLRLVAWDDLSHAQIALTLAISENAVAIRLLRARARFKEALAGERTSHAHDGPLPGAELPMKDRAAIRTLPSWTGEPSGTTPRERES